MKDSTLDCSALLLDCSYKERFRPGLFVDSSGIARTMRAFALTCSTMLLDCSVDKKSNFDFSYGYLCMIGPDWMTLS